MTNLVGGCALLCGMLAVLCGVCAAPAATYYVDFDGGTDNNDGLSAQAAFKHCPGDPAAGDRAKATALRPGDVVIFKGGVVYRGNVKVAWSGAKDKPIIFDGNTKGAFGGGQAIVDGSEVLTGWQRCQSAEDCGGNPNWRHILYTYAPADATLLSANLYDGKQMLWIAQDPDPADPHYMDRAADYRHIAPGSATATTLIDANCFTQAEPNTWDGAYAAIWAQPNYTYFKKVTAYSPAEHKITHEKLPAPHYPNRGRYAMMNHVRLLDKPGEFVFSPERDANGRPKLYLWPRGEAARRRPAITISRRSTAFDINGHSHITVRGFAMQKFISRQPNRGAGVSNDVGKPEGIVVADNVIRYCNKDSSWKHAGINLTGVRGARVENNRVHDNRRIGGIYFLGGTTESVIRGNAIRKCGYVGIWLIGAPKCRILKNTVDDNRGTHSNAITVYNGSDDVLVCGNVVHNSQVAFASEKVQDVTIAYNVFQDSGGYVVCNWFEGKRLRFFNNVILGGEGKALMLARRGTVECVVKNNILGGILINEPADVSHNLYVSHYQGLDVLRKKLKPGEIIETDLGKVFVDVSSRDYRLKPGSPAIDAGTDVGLKEDLAGTKAPQGKAPDIGAYEHVGKKE
ncbi:MAG TPA: right-handed parallel beta-helix repeat-containing protein [Phycisphaerae bacterium]|nr:right-handed parallel beta-helix repeat-containing protein [Phycisphaerae bacterium]